MSLTREQIERDLLPCPFCGAQPLFVADDTYGACVVSCPTPGCETGFFADKNRPDAVVAQWNHRVLPAG